MGMYKEGEYGKIVEKEKVFHTIFPQFKIPTFSYLQIWIIFWAYLNSHFEFTNLISR